MTEENPTQQPSADNTADAQPAEEIDVTVKIEVTPEAAASPTDDMRAGEVPEEVPIAGARATTPHDQAEALIEELEVDIRERPVTQEQTRNLALAVLDLIRANLTRSTMKSAERVLALLRSNISSDYLDPDFWRGVSMIVQYQLEETKSLIQRRLRGDYATDAYGMDPEIVELVRPFAAFLYRSWLRVSVEGVEHVPDSGRALLAANHSGLVPWDSAMIATAVFEEHPSARMVRVLFPAWFTTVPVFAPALTALGQVPEAPENIVRLLNADELVCAFPEGLAGIGKRLGRRARLATFGEGFARAALQTGAPIVPVSVVGGEESAPVIAQVEPLARLFRVPTFPVTLIFPWLGMLGAVPLPTQWRIIFHPPIATESLGAQAADDPHVVSQLVAQVRQAIQSSLGGQRGLFGLG